jgi:hypothetical protein
MNLELLEQMFRFKLVTKQFIEQHCLQVVDEKSVYFEKEFVIHLLNIVLRHNHNENLSYYDATTDTELHLLVEFNKPQRALRTLR